MPDVVYILRRDCGDAHELRYSLRSLKNVPHGDVYIVGGKPGWAKNITHIPTGQFSTRYTNAFRNLVAACKDERISEKFIFMNDDFFIMKKISRIPVLHRGPIDRHRSVNSGMYYDQLMNTKKALVKQGLKNIISYELHVPIIFEKSKLLAALRLANKLGVYNKRTFYGNLWKIGGEESHDVKISTNKSPTGYEQFLSSSDGSFRAYDIGKHIRNRFPDASEYESYDVLPIIKSDDNYRGIAMKIQDYDGGEIFKTNSGNYVFVINGSRSPEYANIASLVHDHELQAEKQPEQPKKNKTIDKKTKTVTKQVKIAETDPENTNMAGIDDAAAETTTSNGDDDTQDQSVNKSEPEQHVTDPEEDNKPLAIDETKQDETDDAAAETTEQPKKRRGRPPKNDSKKSDSDKG